MRLGGSAAPGRRSVLSVAKLTLGQEAYYEQQVALGLDDYYASRGESPGLWAGRGAEELGLIGVVGDGDLETMLRGVNPANKEPAAGAGARADDHRPDARPRVGEWREEQKRLALVSGYDLVFSCPKSVSLLHALTDDERIRRRVSEAHEEACQPRCAYLEREACVVRRGKGGTIREHAYSFESLSRRVSSWRSCASYRYPAASRYVFRIASPSSARHSPSSVRVRLATMTCVCRWGSCARLMR